MTLRLGIHQTAPVRAEPEANRAAMAASLAGAPEADLHLFPELSLTGYDLGALAREVALGPGDPPPPELLAARPGGRGALLLGFPEAGEDGRLFNAVGLADGGGWRLRHRKRYLPTYGAFDEGRVFAPGPAGPPVVELDGGWRVGVLICEELWHPALPYLVGLRGADLLVVAAAAPGRGTPPDDGERGFASQGTWELLARTAAVQHGMWTVVVNRAGVEGGTTFAGGSLVVAPGGDVVSRAAPGRVDRLHVELDRDAVLRARRPFSHLRDEDPRFLAAELARLDGEAAGGPAGGAGGSLG